MDQRVRRVRGVRVRVVVVRPPRVPEVVGARPVARPVVREQARLPRRRFEHRRRVVPGVHEVDRVAVVARRVVAGGRERPRELEEPLVPVLSRRVGRAGSVRLVALVAQRAAPVDRLALEVRQHGVDSCRYEFCVVRHRSAAVLAEGVVADEALVVIVVGRALAGREGPLRRQPHHAVGVADPPCHWHLQIQLLRRVAHGGIALHHLPAERVARYDDLLQVREPRGVAEPLQQLVEGMERRDRLPVRGVLVDGAAGPRGVAPHERRGRVPIGLLLAVGVVREGGPLVVPVRKERRHDGDVVDADLGVRFRRFLQCVEHARVVVLGIPPQPVAHDNGALDGVIGRPLPRAVERGVVDQREVAIVVVRADVLTGRIPHLEIGHFLVDVRYGQRVFDGRAGVLSWGDLPLVALGEGDSWEEAGGREDRCCVAQETHVVRKAPRRGDY